MTGDVYNYVYCRLLLVIYLRVRVCWVYYALLVKKLVYRGCDHGKKIKFIKTFLLIFILIVYIKI
jgi:hypothetical protein